jgi:hypothetical protein
LVPSEILSLIETKAKFDRADSKGSEVSACGIDDAGIQEVRDKSRRPGAKLKHILISDCERDAADLARREDPVPLDSGK